MFDIAIWKFLSLYEFIAWNVFLLNNTFFRRCIWKFLTIFIFKECSYFFVDMFCISIWKFLSLYKSVVRNIIFLRFFSFFCWIIWNFVSFFILEEGYNLFIDMSSVSVFVCYCFYITILRNIFLRCCSIFAWISFNWISIFIYKLSIWTNCWCVSSRNSFT